MRCVQWGVVTLTSLLLIACGGSSSGSGGSDAAPDTMAQSRCSANSNDVNWQYLLEGKIESNGIVSQIKKLSEYNLFEKECDPTTAPNAGGFPYDLTTGLFTDYSSKYRFIFMPPNTSADYSEDEVLEFPVGTVLVKTFSMPKDTAIRGFKSDKDFVGEKLLETRLLIHREGGWIALPYVWNEDQTEAELHVSGKLLPMSIVHNGEQKDFTYAVPDIQTCKQCHQLTNDIDGTNVSRFAPIGPKARLLNRELEFSQGNQNQLAYMVENELLKGAPANLASIDTIPAFNESTDISAKTGAELEALAKGYLDINCAHCHRRTGDATNDGKAGYSGLKLEYWRDLVGGENEHGVCKIPIAFSVQGLAFDIVPGDAQRSILPYRMALTTAKRMPEAGRDLVHGEGVALINAWINSMPAQQCGQ